MGLAGYQLDYLRGLAHTLNPVVLVGDSGLSPGVVAAVDQALIDHELIKVRMRRPADKSAQAEQLARATDAELCALIGHTVILYRQNLERPKIHLPLRGEEAAAAARANITDGDADSSTAARPKRPRPRAAAGRKPTGKPPRRGGGGGRDGRGGGGGGSSDGRSGGGRRGSRSR